MKTRLKLFLTCTFLFGAFLQTSAFAASVASSADETQMSALNNKNDDKDGVEDGNAGAPQRPHDKRKHGHAE